MGTSPGTLGWVSINKSDVRSYNDWHSQFGVSGGAGWYWTDHHKTQVDFVATTAASVYSSEPIVVAPQQQTFVTTVRRYESQRVSLTELYQFGGTSGSIHSSAPAWIIVREQSSRRDDPVSGTTRSPGSRGWRASRCSTGSESEIVARAVLTAGVKAYFSRKVFALTDLRVGIGSQRVRGRAVAVRPWRRLLARHRASARFSVRKLLCLMLTTTWPSPAAQPRARLTTGLCTAGDRQSVDPKVMADYIRQLPVGSRVRLSRRQGDDIRGTLMKNDGDPLVIQRRTRIPEAPIDVPLQDVLAVELEVPYNGDPRGARLR